MAQHICIFAKPPIAGRTKSRLAKSIGNHEAAELSKAMLLDLVTEALLVQDTQVSIWFPPNSKKDEFPSELIDNSLLDWFSQSGEDLGERMAHAISFFAQQKVIIIGSDCITHSCKNLAEAFTYFTSHDMVIQPSDDGGYTLIGQKKLIPQVFQNIEWGTSSVWPTTKTILAEQQIDYYTMSETFDVDVIEDLEYLGEFLKTELRKETNSWWEKFTLSHGAT